jgi:hypothetical protein
VVRGADGGNCQHYNPEEHEEAGKHQGLMSNLPKKGQDPAACSKDRVFGVFRCQESKTHNAQDSRCGVVSAFGSSDG